MLFLHPATRGSVCMVAADLERSKCSVVYLALLLGIVPRRVEDAPFAPEQRTDDAGGLDTRRRRTHSGPGASDMAGGQWGDLFR